MNSALAPSEKMTSSRRKGGSPDSKWCHTRQKRGERQGVGGRAGWSCPRDKRALLRHLVGADVEVRGRSVVVRHVDEALHDADVQCVGRNPRDDKVTAEGCIVDTAKQTAR